MSPATTLAAPAPPRVAPDDGAPRRLWTIAEMIRMVEAGILQEGGPEYLLDGEMFCRMTKHPPHSIIKANLYECLRARLDPTTWTVRVEDPIVLRPDSNPEPDLVVAHGARLDYVHRHPGPADVRE